MHRFTLTSLVSAGCAMCLLLAGCSTPTASVSADPAASASADAANSAQPEGTPGVGEVIGGADFAPAAGDPVDDATQGKARITYNGNESTVRYVTSASELPAYQELKQYDDDFFQDHGLVVVTESVASGSIDVDIDSIRDTDVGHSVVLYHSAPADDQAGTDDMVTWLLWAEVEPDLEGSWTVANPALTSDAVKS